jgi:alkaline phosphatase D
MSGEVLTEESQDYTSHIALPYLASFRNYYYRVRLNGTLQPGAYRFRTAPATRRDFTFVALSDFVGYRPAPALLTAAALEPDFVLFGGDFDHSGPRSLDQARRMHRDLRSGRTPLGISVWQLLIRPLPDRQLPLYHVWDDHDYGANDADASFPGKADALQAFREYFILAGNAGANGIWQRYRYSNAEFFLLDSRSQRNRKLRSRTMLGEEQRSWLKRSLLQSQASWKFMLSPVPFNRRVKPSDAWASFPRERKEIVDFVRAHRIRNVLIISGDLHTGGAFDNGNHSDIPEVSLPHANLRPYFAHATARRLGEWTFGPLSGVSSPGLARFLVQRDRVVIEILGAEGDLRYTTALLERAPTP